MPRRFKDGIDDPRPIDEFKHLVYLEAGEVIRTLDVREGPSPFVGFNNDYAVWTSDIG